MSWVGCVEPCLGWVVLSHVLGGLCCGEQPRSLKLLDVFSVFLEFRHGLDRVVYPPPTLPVNSSLPL